MEETVKAAEQLVRDIMGGWDPSHDPAHVFRVRNLAIKLAREEQILPQSREVVELAALLHDLDDYKYADRNKESVKSAAEEFLVQREVDPEKRQAILHIIQNMGFKDEISGRTLGLEINPEFGVVQDADRLDAIGAIARNWEGVWVRGCQELPMYLPDLEPRSNLSKEAYVKDTTSTINHFHEKLLKLKDMMKTQAGKKMAEKRHTVMKQFVDEFVAEWDMVV